VGDRDSLSGIVVDGNSQEMFSLSVLFNDVAEVSVRGAAGGRFQGFLKIFRENRRAMRKLGVQVLSQGSYLVKAVEQRHTENAYYQGYDHFERSAHRYLAEKRRSHVPYYPAVQNETLPPLLHGLEKQLQPLLPESRCGLGCGLMAFLEAGAIPGRRVLIDLTRLHSGSRHYRNMRGYVFAVLSAELHGRLRTNRQLTLYFGVAID
jgi:hypothetical protein